jgi:hypothetical protein
VLNNERFELVSADEPPAVVVTTPRLFIKRVDEAPHGDMIWGDAMSVMSFGPLSGPQKSVSLFPTTSAGLSLE